MAVASSEENEITSRSICSPGMVIENDFVIDRPHMLQVADQWQPAADNVHVSQSSDVHFGPKYVSVTEHISDIEVARGRIRGVEVSPDNTKRLRCSIAVCVCWTFAVSIILTFFIFYFALYDEEKRLQLDLQGTWYVRRNNWYAKRAREIELLDLPVPNVLIGHSATKFCTEKYDCIQQVLDIQTDHQNERRWEDIGPNFLVGGNGLVFEGRGANIVGIMVKSWNLNGISIMFLGNYIIDEAINEQFDNVKVLLQELVEKRVLTADYNLYGHCQVKGGYVSPGPHVMDNLFRFDHWNSVNTTACVRS